MAELIFKSAGVSTREIDLSGPSQNQPIGVPAGVIGTSNEGPAFVPITVSNFNQFQKTFGNSDGEKFGPLAVNQWLRNAQSCTYIRVLGIGDGKRRNTGTGVVNRAGFNVGDQIIQDGGNIGNNTFAEHSSTVASAKGRVHFLGCFMSESAGSTIFSAAGMQEVSKRASIRILISTGSQLQGSTIQLTSSIAGSETTFESSAFAAGLTNAKAITAVTAALEAMSNGEIVCSAIDASKSQCTAFYSDPGIFGNKYKIAFKSDGSTTAGSITISATANAANTGIDAISLSGGQGGSKGILRGVLMAPSGVIPQLSGNACGPANNIPAANETAGAANGAIFGRRGGITGSLSLSNQNFVLLLNGHKNTSANPNVITASFNPTSKNYFGNVLNKDPLKIESAGHLLYGHYDVPSVYASITGSGVVPFHHKSTGSYAADGLADLAFIVTSSSPRGTDPTSVIPNYEDFKDRFSTAKSPFVISQKLGDNKNLFRIHALSAGGATNTKFKISIENITKINDTTYPTFDILLRKFDDSDDSRQVLETFRNVNLNPNSERYVGRVIGDLNIFFEFDKDELSQKINVTGNHPIKSNFIRVETAADLDNGNIDIKAIPSGFRGPIQVVSSGAIMCTESGKTTGKNHLGNVYSHTELFQQILSPPIPFRQTIARSTGNKKKVRNNLYWGMQFENLSSITEPNKAALFNETFNTYVKHFPTHRLDGRNFAEASDTIGRNLFSLEHIKVRTGSDGKADPDMWLSASYSRDAASNAIGTNTTLKTRAFSVDDLEIPGNRRYAKFSFFLQGGSDGTDIFNKDKNKLLNDAIRREIDNESDQGGNKGATTSAYRKAIDVMGSKSEVDIKLLAIPGIRVPAVTDFAVTAIENRFDALYIMDIEKKNNFDKIITGSADTVNITNTVKGFKNRGLNSSFAAAYFPDVVVQDPTTGGAVSAPASVAVLGAFSLNDAIAHPWFAPAGFTRGALDAVESVDVRLNRKNLDDLYDVDINPLTAFPGTGVVVWGQKTLLSNASALDRVNVRRLLINVRRSVRNIANTLLFEPNRRETLDKFNSLVNPVLQRVQEQGGVDRFKVIIDSSTTTQADVENNTIRGKIFLQPTRAVEFIALDFVVTNAGANI